MKKKSDFNPVMLAVLLIAVAVLCVVVYFRIQALNTDSKAAAPVTTPAELVTPSTDKASAELLTQIVTATLSTATGAEPTGYGMISPYIVDLIKAYEHPLSPAARLKAIRKPGEPTPEPDPELYDVPLDDALQIEIIDLCEDYHIDPAIVFAMIETESTYKIDAMGDRGNAYGLMQIQRRFHLERIERLGVTDLLDPVQNVTVGVDYLAEMVDYYDGNLEMALVAYNAGVKGANEHWFSKGFYSSNYSRDVLATAERLAGGE